jgi:hypothetical protein
VQPVEQVLAEAAAFHVGDQVAVGRRDDPHVDLDGLAAPTDRPASLNGAQQFHLRGRRQFADFIEEQRAAGSLDEFAGVLFGGAGKRPFSCPNSVDSTRFSGMAPQFTATNGLAPFARAMDGARDQLLADAGFALDQHRDQRGGRFLGGAQNCCMRALRVTMSLKLSVPVRLRFNAGIRFRAR